MQALQGKSRLLVIIVLMVAHLMLIRALRNVTAAAPVSEVVGKEARLQASWLPLRLIQPQFAPVPQQRPPMPRPSISAPTVPSVPAASTAISAGRTAPAPDAAISSAGGNIAGGVAGTPEPDDLLSAARRSAGNVDRELRRASPSLPGHIAQSEDNRLARGIAAAGRSPHEMREVKRYADGRTVTSVGSGANAYCVLNGTLPGLDPMQEGRQTRMVNCPD